MKLTLDHHKMINPEKVKNKIVPIFAFFYVAIASMREWENLPIQSPAYMASRLSLVMESHYVANIIKCRDSIQSSNYIWITRHTSSSANLGWIEINGMGKIITSMFWQKY